MVSSLIPPRQVKIGDAASFVGVTPRAIRHYHAIGLLPEPERGSDDRRRYGYEEMIQLLWIRKMADAGIALDDIRDAFAGTTAVDTAASQATGGADCDHGVAGILERLETTLIAQEAELQRQRAAVQRMRSRGSRMGLLSDFVATRLENLPEGSLRQADLDNVLVIERIFGPLGAAVNASRYIALATHPGLREESDCVDAAEETLDDTVAVDDPRVEEVAVQRHAFEQKLNTVIDDSGLTEEDNALFDSWDALHSLPSDQGEERVDLDAETGRKSMSTGDAIRKMPYDWSPARLRCMELTLEMSAQEPPAVVDRARPS
ncbi:MULTISPECIES: MerR family transcriptional regulator [unclassified Arthrobacter]|uniref:MerR family transcriptional regulator n=1 Tax=unclassified Arthrobacter TaxID=235627 RepID=UPI001490F484|nr:MULTISPECIES: MerR family transcriptional regulator [unclassified Arthrobacter]MBE0009808.1 MerR family transcriptional regulator [Arthrobacter sp. AET 35A]NOJ63692.1 MerR family transcriptional regulator [Arthrobacter sp. 147(2020)]